jgi:hypothetical protein
MKKLVILAACSGRCGDGPAKIRCRGTAGWHLRWLFPLGRNRRFHHHLGVIQDAMFLPEAG